MPDPKLIKKTAKKTGLSINDAAAFLKKYKTYKGATSQQISQFSGYTENKRKADAGVGKYSNIDDYIKAKKSYRKRFGYDATEEAFGDKGWGGYKKKYGIKESKPKRHISSKEYQSDKKEGESYSNYVKRVGGTSFLPKSITGTSSRKATSTTSAKSGSYKGHRYSSTKTESLGYKTTLPDGRTVWMNYKGNHQAYMDKNDAKRIAAGADPNQIKKERADAARWYEETYGAKKRADAQAKAEKNAARDAAYRKKWAETDAQHQRDIDDINNKYNREISRINRNSSNLNGGGYSGYSSNTNSRYHNPNTTYNQGVQHINSQSSGSSYSSPSASSSYGSSSNTSPYAKNTTYQNQYGQDTGYSTTEYGGNQGYRAKYGSGSKNQGQSYGGSVYSGNNRYDQGGNTIIQTGNTRHDSRGNSWTKDHSGTWRKN